MNSNVREALTIVVNECLKQDSCRECPLKDICEKQPTEWIDYLGK